MSAGRWALVASVALHLGGLLALGRFARNHDSTAARSSDTLGRDVLEVEMTLDSASDSRANTGEAPALASPLPPTPPTRRSRAPASAAASPSTSASASAPTRETGPALEVWQGVAGTPSEGGEHGEDRPSEAVATNATADEEASSATQAWTELERRVHAQLARGAEQCYPRAARRLSLKGTSWVHFCLDGAGALAQVNVQESSEWAILDAAVGDCVIPSALPFPQEANGRCFEAPIRFGYPRVRP